MGHINVIADPVGELLGAICRGSVPKAQQIWRNFSRLTGAPTVLSKNPLQASKGWVMVKP